MASSSTLLKVSRALLARRSTMVQSVRQSSAYKPAPSWKPPHYDELPVPQGSWKQAFDAKQKKYNMQLAAGVIVFSATLIFISQSELMFFNARVPPLPEETK